MGRTKAIRLLQRALAGAGYDLVDDGIAGPKTMTMVNGTDPAALVRLMILERVMEYVRLCDERPALSRFLGGWCRRCRDLLLFTDGC
jgi:lysozyme family protein